MSPGHRIVSLLLALLGLSVGTAGAIERPGALVETGWLAEHLDEVVLLDVRMEPRSFGAALDPADVGLFAATPLHGVMGHIPGSQAVPWDSLFGKVTEEGKALIGMLPDVQHFTGLMRNAGVNDDSLVVVSGRFADVKELAAGARLYWTLKVFGHDKVALLNGGVAKWAMEKRALSHTATRVSAPGNFTARGRNDDLLATQQEVETALARGAAQLLDARALDLYLGLTYNRTFVPARAKGHIPGAKLLPAKLVADRLGPAVLYPPDEIRAAARAMGVNPDAPAITYCNSGVLCSLTWFALHEVLGNPDVQVYDGAMHQWSSDPARPVTRFVME